MQVEAVEEAFSVVGLGAVELASVTRSMMREREVMRTTTTASSETTRTMR